MTNGKQRQALELENYEILIRRWGPTNYAAYCPQLRLMIKGKSHEEVERKMEEKIRQYVSQQKEEH